MVKVASPNPNPNQAQQVERKASRLNTDPLSRTSSGKFTCLLSTATTQRMEAFLNVRLYFL